MTTYTVTVFAEHSDPVAHAKFRSKRAAADYAAEFEGQTYTNPYDLSEENRNPDGSPRRYPYHVSIHS